MEMDSVRVRPGMLPPTISTTPNSPTVCANVSTAAVSRPGREGGATPGAAGPSRHAPSTVDASRSRGSTAANAPSRGCTANGRLYSTDATSSPVNENGSVDPVSSNHHLPCLLYTSDAADE